MWDGVVESGKYITIYYDTSELFYNPIINNKSNTLHYGVFRGFLRVNYGMCNIVYGQVLSTP